MEVLKIAFILVAACLFISVFGGYGLLKILDEFRMAIAQQNRRKLFLASSMMVFALAVTIIVFTALGMSVQQKLSASHKASCYGTTVK